MVSVPGPNNDLADTLGVLPSVQQKAGVAGPAAVRAMDDTQANIALLRPYTPDLLSFLGNFGAVTANYDGNGHYARVHPAAQNIFDYADNGARR